MTTPKKRTGRKPSAVENKKMRADGYLTPAELAQELDVARSTVYGWAKLWAESKTTYYPAGSLTNGRPATRTGDNGAVWVLAAYARRQRRNGRAA